MSICAASSQDFHALLRIASSSAADPPWFAAPIGVEEEDDKITLIFHVPTFERVRVHLADDRVLIYRDGPCERGSAVRVCVIPFRIVQTGLACDRSGDLLRVRIHKLTPDADRFTSQSRDAR